MSKVITTYEVSTGSITSRHSGPTTVIDNYIASLPATEGYVLGDYSGNSHYIPSGAPTEKLIMPLVITEGLVTGIPVGAVANIEGHNDTETINDGEIDLRGSTPQEYIVQMELFPYVNTDITVEVTV